MEGKKNDKRAGKICIRRKIDEMWINKFGKEKNKGRLKLIQDYDWKGSNISDFISGQGILNRLYQRHKDLRSSNN